MLTMFCTLKILISLLIGLICSIDDQSTATDFFAVHHSSTVYKQNNKEYTAAVTCRSDNCTLIVHYPGNENGKYKIKRQFLRIMNGCPPAVCGDNKGKFTTNPNDNCPICDYGSYYRREPCRSSDHCPMKLGCSRQRNCHYRKEPDTAELYDPFCQYKSDCPAFYKCSNRICQPAAEGAFHIEGRYCYSDSDCPNPNFRCYSSQYVCLAKKNYCETDDMCRSGFVCNTGTNRCKKLT